MSTEELQEKRLRALEDGHLITHRDMKDIKEILSKLTDSIADLAQVYTGQEVIKEKMSGVDTRIYKLEVNQKWFITAIVILMGTALIDVVVL